MAKGKNPSKEVMHYFGTMCGKRASSTSVKMRTGGVGVYEFWHTLNGMGCTINQEWIDMPKAKYPNEYWNGCVITRPDGSTESGESMYKRVTTPKSLTEEISPVNVAEFEISSIPRDDGGRTWTIVHRPFSGKVREWTLEAKLVLNLEDIHHILPLMSSFIPSGKSAVLQADSHRAGNCWVGLVCSYDDKRIPFTPISADIGCGMCLVPILKDGEQLLSSEVDMEKLQLQVSYRARNVLARGNVAEKGEVQCSLVKEAMTFIGEEDGTDVNALAEWVDEFDSVMEELCIPHCRKTDTLVEGLTECQNMVLSFILGFSATLGSSGNHFLEMNEGEDGRLYFVVHSGSRGLGAMIYKKISILCTAIYGQSAVATGKFATLYNRAFSVLNKFAVMNRVLCAISVLNDLGFEKDGHVLRDYLIEKNPLFTGIGAENPAEVSSILRGVTHNGVKCFVDHTTKRKIFILCKGAIAISRRSSCGIVALRAGEGVYVLTLLDRNAKWVECDLGNLSSVESYTTIRDPSLTDIQMMGHGAGRSGSATGTWNKSSYMSMLEYYDKYSIVGNLSPNVLGDNPEIAYKPVEEVVAHLPLDIALSSGMLRTRVNHKEGIDHRPRFKSCFIDFLDKEWDTLTPRQKIMCDLILVKWDCDKRFGEEWWTSKFEEQKKLYEISQMFLFSKEILT